MNELKFKGIIDKIYDKKQGTSKNGTDWATIDFIAKDTAQYPQSAKFTLFGLDKVDKFLKYTKVGDEVEVSFNLKIKEHDSKEYNTINAWSIFKAKTNENTNDKVDRKIETPTVTDDNDLPF